MLRVVLLLILLVFIARAFWRVVDGVREGLGGASRRPAPPAERGVHMVRDPVCGTFVVPERAVSLLDGSSRLFFCSTACRDRYRAGAAGAAERAAGSPRADRESRAGGRTA